MQSAQDNLLIDFYEYLKEIHGRFFSIDREKPFVIQ